MTDGQGRWGGRRGAHARHEHDIDELRRNSFTIVKPERDSVAGMFASMADFFAKKGQAKTKDE
jgi:hypothetical protein